MNQVMKFFNINYNIYNNSKVLNEVASFCRRGLYNIHINDIEL